MKKITLILIALMGISFASAQTKVGGVNIPGQVTFEGEEMMLNGAGVREKLWIDMYAGGLYLQTKSNNAPEIVNADKPMAIKLHIVSKLITSNRMVDAVNEGFESATGGNTGAISSKIDTFKGFFLAEIKKNDVFDLVYIPSKGVTVYKNDKLSGTIEGMDFKKALFGIWLSNRPADDDLKDAMLGK